jgi:predicted acyltransferase
MTSSEDSSPASSGESSRLLSIDALRGFDMFWIIGGEEIVKEFAKWSSWPSQEVRHELVQQFEHVDWEGFRFYDLIFPLFLFIVGVVLPFSLGKLQERGCPKGSLYGRVLRRVVLLFFLGLLYNGFLMLDFANLRIAGVLQRIALAYGFAAIIVINTRWRGQLLTLILLLVGYWAILAYIGAPDSHSGDYSKETNLAGYIDRHYLPGKIVKAYYGFGDNEGILSTIPSVGTALLGALAGQLLRGSMASLLKVLFLTVAGGLSLKIGFYWGEYFPIIKNLWTSSFVLVAGGWSLLLLALFYLVIDVIKLRRWAFFFVVIGSNAITIYVGQHIIDFEKMAKVLMGGVAHHSGAAGPLVLAISVVALEWLFLWYLYERKLFLRV